MKRLYVKRWEIKLDKEKFSTFVMSDNFDWFLIIRSKDSNKIIDEPISVNELTS